MNEVPSAIFTTAAPAAMDADPSNAAAMGDYEQLNSIPDADGNQEDASVAVSSIETSPLRKSQERSRESVDCHDSDPSPDRNDTLFDKPFYSTNFVSTTFNSPPWNRSADPTGPDPSTTHTTNALAAYTSPCLRQVDTTEERDMVPSYREGSGTRRYSGPPESSGGYRHRRKYFPPRYGSPYPEVKPYISTTLPGGFYDFSKEASTPPTRPDIEYQAQVHPAPLFPYHYYPYQAPPVGKSEYVSPASNVRPCQPFLGVSPYQENGNQTVSRAVTFSPQNQKETKTLPPPRSSPAAASAPPVAKSEYVAPPSDGSYFRDTSPYHETAKAAVSISPASQKEQKPPPHRIRSSPASMASSTTTSASLAWLRPRYNKKMSRRNKVSLDTWYARLRDLYEYKAKHGDCMVPQKYPPNPALGVWVNKQRMEHKLREDGEKSSMTDEKMEELQKVGFVWAKRRGDHSWTAKFEQLRKYYYEHGDCLVPTKYSKNPSLGRWVSTQRSQYKLLQQGQRSTMTETRAAKLSSIGFKWNVLK